MKILVIQPKAATSGDSEPQALNIDTSFTDLVAAIATHREEISGWLDSIIEISVDGDR